jgi:uncharacterized protein (DUF2164 family)
MSAIELPKATLEALAYKLKHRLSSELNVEIGRFEAIDLVDFCAETMGPHFYNQGLQDAQEIYRKKFEEIADSVIEIEKQVKI